MVKGANIARRPFRGHEREDCLAFQLHTGRLVGRRSQGVSELRRNSQNLGLDRRADSFFPCENTRDCADGDPGALGDIRLARTADVGRIVHIGSCACKKICYDANIANKENLQEFK